MGWRMKTLGILGLVAALAACGRAPDPLTDELPSMGDFQLGHAVVVTTNMQRVPPSRTATPEEWEAVLTSELNRRFGDYEGGRLYHLGVSIDGYALAPPGIPLVMNPQSVLVLSVNLWDDALGQKLHSDPEQILVVEGAARETFLIGSGFARNREQQMQVLSRNAARQIQRWLLENPEWFSIDPEAPPFRAARTQEEADLAALAVGPVVPPMEAVTEAVTQAPAEPSPQGSVPMPVPRPVAALE